MGRFGPIAAALTVVLLVTGTPRERHTTHGDENPPLPPSPPQSFCTFTNICEKFVSARKLGIWSSGIRKLTDWFPPVLVDTGPSDQLMLKGGVPDRRIVADTTIPVEVKKVLVKPPMILGGWQKLLEITRLPLAPPKPAAKI